MTREKKEILNRIDKIEEAIRVDEELGCGMAPAGAYDELYEEIDRLWTRLANLRGYKTAEAMWHAQSRYHRMGTELDFPFM